VILNTDGHILYILSLYFPFSHSFFSLSSSTSHSSLSMRHIYSQKHLTYIHNICLIKTIVYRVNENQKALFYFQLLGIFMSHHYPWSSGVGYILSPWINAHSLPNSQCQMIKGIDSASISSSLNSHQLNTTCTLKKMLWSLV
jgi:hypothetical protein